MSDALATIYSRSDAFKRKLIDALRNPRLAAEQIVGDANDRARVLNEATSAAVDESIVTRNPLSNGPANQRLAQMIAGAYNPAGIFIGPMAKAWSKAAAELRRLYGLNTELLAELKTVVFHLRRDDFKDGGRLRLQAIDSIEAAIAKATGGEV